MHTIAQGMPLSAARNRRKRKRITAFPIFGKSEGLGMKRFKTAIVIYLFGVMLFCGGCGTSGQEPENTEESTASSETTETESTESKLAESESADKDGNTQMPDFTMTLLNGDTVSFADYLGKKVILNFWATWCGPCVGEMPAFQKLADEYPDELVILAVNCSEPQGTVQEFIDANGYTFPIVLDEDGAIQAMFGGITSIPVTVIIDEEGYIASSSTGAADADTMYDAYKEALGW